ncbi:wax ester/triacylglycerol synthase family O-acyltransferase [Bradyrhizobium sp. AUGA SZCCT0176]|uniref:WS/DGAT/MGAT family O-acyltransferase n=1 Tax=unclassified Bradyrhizobium TaxID=2631580 RepID=UPI001BA9B426|nr:MULTISPECIES: wax ester/triacylglycerol synthase family O-acyltransferase [unclassified Bradyrhizobium]MBR1228022.1 wax ester/triacylglycerol synthase family O-acyltransferase [Bradyrhizobium sp. AUGA SZCCT0176]MBR1237045.1 wax ester/triacylglycerol synthase family O-acyltransferase [Bradyrhizobium sp. AUGA SZCCT0182]MBR1286364.1 wax ester/triacylglycerol synthase family O-acyltransferase [Bradyrhizobium sp. AUGA SZCCT0177]
MDQLSGMDASFLHLETPETPMHVGSLMLFELPDGYQGDYYEEVKAMLGKRLHLASVLCRKLAQMPFELAEPVWIEDDDIDLDYHVRSVTLRRPGTMAQLEQLIARLHSTLLDRSRPLWEMYVIEGLENGQVAFYSKAHHSGVDGKAGVELAKVLYDVSPQMREVPPPRRKRGGVSYQLGVTELLQAAVANSAEQYRKLADLLPTAAKALTAAATVVANQRTTGGERSLNLGLAPRTIFNDSITNQRSYTTLSLPLADIKQLGKRVGGTVNTIVMAVCSVALDRFLKERDLLPKETLIAVVPVSLRTEGDSAMNNQVSIVRVDLATDIKDIPARFKAIHASSEAAKAVVRELKPVLGVNVPITGSPWLMTGLASLLGRSNFASRAPAAGNVLISNVPGPPTPLYMAGARMVHYHPVSIPYHGSALNITVQSYAGLLEFGLTACRRVLSQEESYELVEHLRAALREIEALPPVEQAPGGASGADASRRSA